MSDKIFDFDKQLRVGDEGEQMFIKHYPHLFPIKSDDLKYDIRIGKDKYRKIELKTDSYCMNKTENFFMEKWGNWSKKDLGGPWRAWEHEVDWFVYLFIKQKTYFWFEPETLCLFLDEYIKDKYVVQIKNNGWTTNGYKVPRKELEYLWVRKDTFKNE